MLQSPLIQRPIEIVDVAKPFHFIQEGFKARSQSAREFATLVLWGSCSMR